MAAGEKTPGASILAPLAPIVAAWRAIGARTYPLAEVNQALADAEAMRLPKALVKPH